MKRVLIISPNFPPVNGPDMQRIRMSLPYYKAMGWTPTVICVNEKYIEGFRDPLLNETVPPEVEVHRVKAWPVAVTRKFGLGSLSIRSYFHFRKKGNELLGSRKFDLVFFSTTMFHVCALGPYWLRKFDVPFVIDMQDPWRNDFYLSVPPEQRPPKFRLAYTIDKKLEAKTMPYAAGIMSVSEGYIDVLKNRYPVLKDRPGMVLPFGCSTLDFDVVRRKSVRPEIIDIHGGKINVVYVGAVTKFFLPLLQAFFKAFARNIRQRDDYHFYFIGTNYAAGAEDLAVAGLAASLGLGDIVTEVPGRIPYFSALATLLHSDILFIPGSTDVQYNASKVYNNILSGRPIFSIFHEDSLVKKVIEECDAGLVVGARTGDTPEELEQKIGIAMEGFKTLHHRKSRDVEKNLQPYSAEAATRRQIEFFEQALASSGILLNLH